MAHLQKIIITEQRVGRGTERDPTRMVTQFFSTEGELLGETDPLAPQYDTCKSEWIYPAWMKLRVGVLKH